MRDGSRVDVKTLWPMEQELSTALGPDWALVSITGVACARGMKLGAVVGWARGVAAPGAAGARPVVAFCVLVHLVSRQAVAVPGLGALLGAAAAGAGGVARPVTVSLDESALVVGYQGGSSVGLLVVWGSGQLAECVRAGPHALPHPTLLPVVNNDANGTPVVPPVRACTLQVLGDQCGSWRRAYVVVGLRARAGRARDKSKGRNIVLLWL